MQQLKQVLLKVIKEQLLKQINKIKVIF